jgi:NAD+ kinase
VTQRELRRVVVVAKVGAPESVSVTTLLVDWLEGRGIEVELDSETASAIGRREGADREDLPGDADLLIVAGGDGTLLSVARSAAPKRVPILGINFGSLGFLTELQPDESLQGLEAVLQGRFAIDLRQMLRVRLSREGETEREYALLNDVVITKSALARMVTIRLSVDDEHVATYTSDGLIVATPTGSTAYNLSAGGPILDPRMNAFVVAPICPHTMTYRPLVVPADVTLRIALESQNEEVYLTLDGQIGFPFRCSDGLVVDRHPEPLRLVRVARRGFFEILRRKLRWGER